MVADPNPNRAKQELEVSRRFMEVFQRKLDLLRTTTSSNDFQLEPVEKKLLLQINNFGLAEGVIAGAVSLVVLRKIRSGFAKRIYEAQLRRAANSGENKTMMGNSPFERPNPASVVPSSGLLYRTFGWALDLGGAFSVAAMTSFACSDVKRILKTLEEIPLVEGRSRVATELCPELDQAIKDVRADVSVDNNILDEPRSEYLQALMQFHYNCQRRAAYEKQLRIEKGVGESYSIAIPPPGVPRDMSLTMDNENENPDDFYDPFVDQSSSQWADSLVSDKEEGSRD